MILNQQTHLSYSTCAAIDTDPHRPHRQTQTFISNAIPRIKHIHSRYIVLAFQNMAFRIRIIHNICCMYWYVINTSMYYILDTCFSATWLVKLPTSPNLLPPVQSEGLVLRCPSRYNDSNSLMLMLCLSLGPCWDHHPTSGGHSLAPGRGGLWTGETEERGGKKRRGKGGFWFDACRIHHQTDWPPQAKKTCG